MDRKLWFLKRFPGTKIQSVRSFAKLELQVDKLKAGLSTQKEMTEARGNITKSLSDLWQNGNLQTKRIIQSTIFPEGIHFEKATDKLSIRKLGEGFVLID